MADTDTSTVITDQFPREPYSFDAPPPDYLIGPLKTIFTAVGQAIQDATSQMVAFQQQQTVQSATGQYLDDHGVLYGVVRLNAEDDTGFRARILGAMHAGKLTLDAIQKAVVNYYAATIPFGGSQPTVTVFDLQSNPTQANADGIVILQFEIDVAFNYSISEGMFLDYGYLDNAYLAPYTGEEDSLGDALAALLSNVKAGNTEPVYFVSSKWS